MAKSTLFMVLFIFFVHNSGSKYGLAKGDSQEESSDLSITGNLGGMITSLLSFITNLLTSVVGLPISLPKDLILTVGELVKNLVTLNISGILKMPLNAVTGVLDSTMSTVEGLVSVVSNTLIGIRDLNADVMGGISNLVRGILGRIVKLLTSVNISGLESLYNVGVWLGGRVDQITTTVTNLIVTIVTTLMNTVSGVMGILPIKELTQLPGLKQITGALGGVLDWNSDQMFKALTNLSNFIGKIVSEHKDFFMPIFNWILNLLEAGEKAWNTLREGGNFSGIMSFVNNIREQLEPLMPESLDIGVIYGTLTDLLKNPTGGSGGEDSEGSTSSDDGAGEGGASVEMDGSNTYGVADSLDIDDNNQLNLRLGRFLM